MQAAVFSTQTHFNFLMFLSARRAINTHQAHILGVENANKEIWGWVLPLFGLFLLGVSTTLHEGLFLRVIRFTVLWPACERGL
jgi:hypothetical protein